MPHTSLLKIEKKMRRQINVTDRISRIWYLKRPYFKLITSGLYRVGVKDLIRTQFPYIFPDTELPPSINLELTNRCQLRCTYCTSPLKLRPTGFMTDSTYWRVIAQIREYRIKRIRVVGNGEPTFHPNFRWMIKEIAESTDYVELKTSLQYVKDATIEAVVKANIDAIRISVDSNSKEEYETLRQGGNFETLLTNLKKLIRTRNSLRGKSLITITVMLKPSDQEKEYEMMAFWKPYCDLVSKQYVLDMKTGESDSFLATTSSEEWPRCSFPFKELKVFWDGNVPLCKYSHLQTRDDIGLPLGNINTDTIPTLWNGPIMKQYRNAHRNRNTAAMPICRGCFGT
ncbi:MAG: radical SAM/SPASM domain-containing protein [Nitrospira sp.]|nr:radical SAM protein [Nitrospira sp.]